MKKNKKALTMMDIIISFAIFSCFLLFLSIFLKNFMHMERETKKIREADNFASNAMQILISDESNDVYALTDKIQNTLGNKINFNLVKESYVDDLYIFRLYIYNEKGELYEEYQIIK